MVGLCTVSATTRQRSVAQGLIVFFNGGRIGCCALGRGVPGKSVRGGCQKGRMCMKGGVWIGTVVAVLLLSTGALAGGSGIVVGNGADGHIGLLAYNRIPLSSFPKEAGQEPCWYVTESGYVAAVEEHLLDRAIFWAGLGDEKEFVRFLESNPLVFPLRAGLRVRIDKFSFSDKVRIRPDGTSISVWTVREAIRSEFLADGS